MEQIRLKISEFNFHFRFHIRNLKIYKTHANSIFGCHSPVEVKLLTRLRLELNNFREHKFKHSFHDNLSPFCSCEK